MSKYAKIGGIVFFISTFILFFFIIHIPSSTPESSTSSVAYPFAVIFAVVVGLISALISHILGRIIEFFVKKYNKNSLYQNSLSLKIFVGILLVFFLLIYLPGVISFFNKNKELVKYEEDVQSIGVKLDSNLIKKITDHRSSLENSNLPSIKSRSSVDISNTRRDNPLVSEDFLFGLHTYNIEVNISTDLVSIKKDGNRCANKDLSNGSYLTGVYYLPFKSDTGKPYLFILTDLRATLMRSLVSVFDGDCNLIYQEIAPDSDFLQLYDGNTVLIGNLHEGQYVPTPWVNVTNVYKIVD